MTKKRIVFLSFVIISTIFVIIALLIVARCRATVPVPSSENNKSSVKVVANGRLGRQKQVSRPEIKVSAAVETVCGFNRKNAHRFVARISALRSIADRHNLPPEDIDMLMAYVASTDDVLRADRVAGLKNDVLNLLRNQVPVPEQLPMLLVDMIACEDYDTTIADYCVQHLGAMWRDLEDEELRENVREVFRKVAACKNLPYAGTALYSLADEPGASAESAAKLRRLTVDLACDASANHLARITAIQLAARRGYTEVLPTVRAILEESHPDTVLATVAIGTIGCLGGAGDVPMLEKLRVSSGHRLRPALDTALARLNGAKSFK